VLIDQFADANGFTVVIQESNEALSEAKSAAQQSVGKCRRLTAECRRLRDQLSQQKQDNQKLRDQMMRVSLKGRTEEQVSE